MARYEAQVWVSGDHPYQCEINAANIFAARKNIARREGVEEHEVNRIFEVRDDDTSSSSSSSSSSMDIGGSAAILGILLAIGAIVADWYIVLPVAIIIGILWYYINNT